LGILEWHHSCTDQAADWAYEIVYFLLWQARVLEGRTH